jgi:hypothetical protein
MGFWSTVGEELTEETTSTLVAETVTAVVACITFDITPTRRSVVKEGRPRGGQGKRSRVRAKQNESSTLEL